MRLAIAILVLAVSASGLRAAESQSRSASVKEAIDRGLAFLAKDAMAWREQYKCVSCHHASLVVWAMHEGQLRGHAVDDALLAELTAWIAESGDGKTGVPRPEGVPEAFNTKALYFAQGLIADPKPNDVTRQGLARFWTTLEADQTASGKWAAWPETRPPFFGPSDESMTVLAALVLLPAAAAGDEAAGAAHDEALHWLDRTASDDDPQSVAMRLVLWQRMGHPAYELAPLAARIRVRQNADGGWSQTADMASDAWATGQALYALAHTADSANVEAIQRGQAFLVATQRVDGSWPMTSRPTTPGGEGSKNLVPIVGGGSAWAVIGLRAASSLRLDPTQGPHI